MKVSTQELDEAARRRLIKRLYIPLPEPEARRHLVSRLMSTQNHALSEEVCHSFVPGCDRLSLRKHKNAGIDDFLSLTALFQQDMMRI